MSKAININHVFSALSDSTRRDILTLLLEDDMAVTDIAEPFSMSLAAISKHLGVLNKAGLISQERRGRVNWCKLEYDALREVSLWVESFGLFSNDDFKIIEYMLKSQNISQE